MLYSNVEYLKITFIILARYNNNIKLSRNIRTLFEMVKLQDISDNRCAILIKMIQRALSAIDIGIRDPRAVFDLAYEEESEDVRDINSRVDLDLNVDLVSMMSTFYSTYILKKPLVDKIDPIMNALTALHSGGIQHAVYNFNRLTNILDNLKIDMEKVTAADIVEELMISGMNMDIGLNNLVRDRKMENSFKLNLFPGINHLFGGGVQTRKAYLVCGLTGGFKSGTLLNICLYAKDNGEVPDFYLEGLKPIILYITHENTLTQTGTRTLKFYGYTSDEISAMTDDEYKAAIAKCLAPGKGGIHFKMQYIESGRIGVDDLKKMNDDLKAAGYKVVLLVDDYAKHLKCALTEDERANNMTLGEKIARQLSELAKSIFAPVMTAGQFNRDGETTYHEAKRKCGLGGDYLRYLNRGHVAGSYNATQLYETILFIDRGVVGIGNNKVEYFCAMIAKDRDNTTDMKSEFGNYVVMKFKDHIGFRIDDGKIYKSIDELNPAKSEMIDAFHNVHAQLAEEKKRMEIIKLAKESLERAGLSQDEISSLDEADLIARAMHTEEGLIGN